MSAGKCSLTQRGSLLLRRWLVLGGIAITLLGGCSAASIGYSNAPLLLAYRGDAWLSLDSGQFWALKRALEDAHDWHRRTQLAGIVGVLNNARERLQHPVTSADVDWAVDEVQREYRVTASRLIEVAAPALAGLRPEQVAHLERRFARRNAEFAEKYIDAPPARVRETRFERVRNNVEDWLGSLTPEQERWLRARVAAIPVDYRAVLADNERRQRELVAILNRHIEHPNDLDETVAAVRRWATDWEAARSPQYQAQSAAWMHAYKQLVVDLLHSATPGQKRHTGQRLNGYVQAVTPFVEPASQPGAAMQ
jgi:hypothetical protein